MLRKQAHNSALYSSKTGAVHLAAEKLYHIIEKDRAMRRCGEHATIFSIKSKLVNRFCTTNKTTDGRANL